MIPLTFALLQNIRIIFNIISGLWRVNDSVMWNKVLFAIHWAFSQECLIWSSESLVSGTSSNSQLLEVPSSSVCLVLC